MSASRLCVAIQLILAFKAASAARVLSKIGGRSWLYKPCPKIRSCNRSVAVPQLVHFATSQSNKVLLESWFITLRLLCLVILQMLVMLGLLSAL